MSGTSRKKAEESVEGEKHHVSTSFEAEKRAQLEAKCDSKPRGRKTNQPKWSIEPSVVAKVSSSPMLRKGFRTACHGSQE